MNNVCCSPLGCHPDIVIVSLVSLDTIHDLLTVDGLMNSSCWLLLWNMVFVHILGRIIIPSDELLLFRGVCSTTNQARSSHSPFPRICVNGWLQEKRANASAHRRLEKIAPTLGDGWVLERYPEIIQVNRP